jgi:hypothetical protein
MPVYVAPKPAIIKKQATRVPIRGIIRARQLPENWSVDEFKYRWLLEPDVEGKFVGKARIPYRERSRYTVEERENLITTNGISNLLTFMGLSSGTATLFFKVISVGTGLISGVDVSDTSVTTELKRLVPTGTLVTGNQQDVSILFGTADGNGTWSNTGIYGAAATTTLGTGTLHSHALFSYIKAVSFSTTLDYVLIISQS